MGVCLCLCIHLLASCMKHCIGRGAFCRKSQSILIGWGGGGGWAESARTVFEVWRSQILWLSENQKMVCHSGLEGEGWFSHPPALIQHREAPPYKGLTKTKFSFHLCLKLNCRQQLENNKFYVSEWLRVVFFRKVQVECAFRKLELKVISFNGFLVSIYKEMFIVYCLNITKSKVGIFIQNWSLFGTTKFAPSIACFCFINDVA